MIHFGSPSFFVWTGSKNIRKTKITRCASTMASCSSGPSQDGSDDKKTHEHSNEKRLAIYGALLTSYENGVLKRGALTNVAKSFDVGFSTVKRIWDLALANMEDGKVKDLSVFKKQSGLRGRQPKYKRNELEQKIEAVPLHKRTTQRQLSRQIGVPEATLRGYNEREPNNPIFKRKASSVNPILTDENREERIAYCKSQMRGTKYNDFTDTIFLDEKWFQCTRARVNYLVTQNEELPTRRVRNKNKLERVMFLAAVTRPQYDAHRNRKFDGKLGIWPVVKEIPARRSSKYRKRGTLEVHDVTVDTDLYEEYLVEKLLPAIVEKCPASMTAKTIYIQQDNASSHKAASKGQRFQNCCKDLGLDVVLTFQPPNSPDLNVLDLSIFNGLQHHAFQDKLSNSREELVRAVDESFRTYSVVSLEKSFLTLQAVMNAILKSNGETNYTLPHINKAKLMRENNGELPPSIEVWTEPIVEAAEQKENDESDDMDHKMPAKQSRQR
jgi:hypothetical protein